VWLWMDGAAYILTRAQGRPVQAGKREGTVLTMAENNTNRIVMYLSIVVVVLLVAFVAVVIVVSGGTKTATVPTSTVAGAGTTATSTTQAGMSPSAAGFDPATATRVPSSSDPVKFVTTYYQSILDKKWEEAFKMQPAASQVGQTVAAFQQTQEQMYGMTSFKIFSNKVGATDATVVVQQELGTNGTWSATWTFVKDNGTWLVKARQVAMGAPTATK
jgi:ABC-type transport system substrate-binding protein